MPDFLLQLDHRLFYFINHTLSNRFFDWIMPYLRYPQFWIPVYVFIFVFCLWRYQKKGVVIILLLVATFAVADFGSAGVIKPLVKRLRPCNDPALAQTIISRVPCGTGYSFPSSHASNHFAIAIFLICVFYKRWRGIWFWALLWACIVCFAQMYVGVHYPIDILSGAIYGTIVGYMFGSVLYQKLEPRF
jgi:membrane-associated phospholipid phosphatase